MPSSTPEWLKHSLLAEKECPFFNNKNRTYNRIYSTVTLLAKFRGWSTLRPLATAT